MSEAEPLSAETCSEGEHFDVLIVGAGISGIGGAYHLTKQCPETSFVILESQDSFGGTWLTHRYPGIRSDSDLHTFGYRFKPWVGPPIATAEAMSWLRATCPFLRASLSFLALAGRVFSSLVSSMGSSGWRPLRRRRGRPPSIRLRKN